MSIQGRMNRVEPRTVMSALARIAVTFALLVPIAPFAGEPSSAQLPPQKGISYSAWWPGQYSDPGADISLERLAATGATWISLIVTRYQESPGSTTIGGPGPGTPTDDDLIHVIQSAHDLGLKVMLKPHVDIPNDLVTGIWRGHIGTEFDTEAQWSAWFASYRAFIEYYASLAQAHGADQFCVGTELLGTTHRSVDWRAVVAGVRAVYDGPLVYAALHGGEEQAITWWDAVDYIGIDAYYPLDNDLALHPTTSEFEVAWEGPKKTMGGLSAQYGKPVVLTEIGYRSHHGCGYHPWDSTIVSPLDLEEQANAYEAAFRQLFREPWLGGIFWWTWEPDRFKSGPYDDGFTPHLKPAENVLRTWYGAPPLPTPPLLMVDNDQRMDVYRDELISGWDSWSWNATVEFSAADQVYSGSRSISVTLEPWGALSLWHPVFRSDAFHWLEFYLRGASSSPSDLTVFFHDANGVELPPVPLLDQRHLSGGPVDPESWKRVRIPLCELNVRGAELSRLNIQNNTGASSTSFWIDDVRLVAAKEPAAQACLPLVLGRP